MILVEIKVSYYAPISLTQKAEFGNNPQQFLNHN